MVLSADSAASEAIVPLAWACRYMPLCPATSVWLELTMPVTPAAVAREADRILKFVGMALAVPVTRTAEFVSIVTL